jgi:phosphoglycolate phosphatase
MNTTSSGVELVLFDLDGTLTDSEPGIAAAYRHTLGALGLPVDEARIRACIGPPLTTSLATLGIPPERIGEAVAVWRPWFATHGIFDNAVYPGVPDMLQRLHRAGIRMGLATAKLRRYAVDILDHFELSAYFDPVAGATADGRLTHKDEIVADALLEAGIPGSSRVVMVGDREHDMYGATANGVSPLGVSYGYGQRAELEAGGARWVVDSPAEVADVLLTLAAAG